MKTFEEAYTYIVTSRKKHTVEEGEAMADWFNQQYGGLSYLMTHAPAMEDLGNVVTHAYLQTVQIIAECQSMEEMQQNLVSMLFALCSFQQNIGMAIGQEMEKGDEDVAGL